MKKIGYILPCFLFLIFGIASAQSPHPSIHKIQSQHYGQFGNLSETKFDSVFGRTATPKPKYNFQNKSACTLTKAVFGWNPYWVGTAYNNYNFNLLSTFCYFSYELDPTTGDYSSIHSWKTTNSITLAQSAGCRVSLCVTNFGGTNNTTFLTNSTAQQTLIDSLIVLLNDRNAKGVNIDFEGVPGSQSANLTSFMTNLSNQVKTAISGASISMAVYSVDWSSVFNIPALTPYVDQFIIMGYGYYYSSSTYAGPTDPLYSGNIWSSYNLVRSINYYLNQGVPNNKLLIGLPYYGYEWETANNNVPGATTGNFNAARTYTFIRNNASGDYSATNKYFDNQSFTSYYVFQTGVNWHQAFVDDAYCLGKRYDMINQKNIGGIGIWALGYDDGYTDLWNEIKDKFTTCAVHQCRDTIYDMGGPYGNYYDDADYTFTISPDNAQGLSINFTNFSTESGYDTLWIYDGNSTVSALIGAYSGTATPGNIIASGNSLTFRFHSDGATVDSGWTAIYQCLHDTTKPTTQIIFPPQNSWVTQNFTAQFADTDNVGIEKRFYEVLDFDGTRWQANQNNGFFYDDFDTTLNSAWTNISGSWNITNHVLHQSDESNGNTNIYASLNQSLSNRYLYHWQGKISGSGTNKRAGLHFFCDSAQLTNRGNSYFVYFRSDDDKVQIYSVKNDTFTLQVNTSFTLNDNQWYDYKVVYDRILGKIWVYINDQLVAQWIDPNPLSTGNAVSFRSGNCQYDVDDFNVYRSRYAYANISVGAASTNDIRSQNPSPSVFSAKIKSIVNDSVYNLSAVSTENLNVDWTPPATISYVNDENATDVDTSGNNTQISANWQVATDTNSGINYYQYAIGSNPGDSDILNWATIGNTTIYTLNPANLNIGQTYYQSVRAVNNAGLIGSIASSDGVYITDDTTGISNYNLSNKIKIYPNPFSKSIVIKTNLNKSEHVLIVIYDNVGRIVFRQKINLSAKNSYQISDVANWVKGIYHIQISGESIRLNKVIIKKGK